MSSGNFVNTNRDYKQMNLRQPAINYMEKYVVNNIVFNDSTISSIKN